MSPFSNSFNVFFSLSTSRGRGLAWSLPYFQQDRPNFVRISFLGRSQKLHAEKSCRFVVVSCRYQCFSCLLWPNKISEFRLILMHFVWCSVCSWSFEIVPSVAEFLPSTVRQCCGSHDHEQDQQSRWCSKGCIFSAERSDRGVSAAVWHGIYRISGRIGSI